MKEMLVKFLATGFFTGYIPCAPGTFGTLLGLPILFLLKGFPFYLSLAVLIAFSLFSMWICEEAGRIYNEKDPRCVVIDEIAGYLYASIFFPFTWKVLVASFILFRFFDIVKPYPVNVSERIKGGAGIIADDILSGFLASLSLYFLNRFTHLF